MRLKGHAYKRFGILALAGTLFSVLPGPTAHAVEAIDQAGGGVTSGCSTAVPLS
jgi:hypothetical protein